jgi:hypothetical protein
MSAPAAAPAKPTAPSFNLRGLMDLYIRERTA